MRRVQRQKNNSGLLVVVAGPSCSGKTTIAQLLLEVYTGVAVMSISATTRVPRHSEMHGVDYWFLSKEDFLHRKDDGEFYETNFYAPSKKSKEGAWYGTPKKELDNMLAHWSPVIAIMDVNGHQSMRETFTGPILSIFLSAPAKELRKRMKDRGFPKSVIDARMRIASQEKKCLKDFDEHIVNMDIHETKFNIVNIINTRLKELDY